MSKTIDYLRSMLHCFLDEFYSEGVKNARKDLGQYPEFRDNWPTIVRMILNRELEEGQALDLIHNTANLPMFENSDEEAYRWLTLMIINVAGDEGDPIIDYQELGPRSEMNDENNVKQDESE